MAASTSSAKSASTGSGGAAASFPRLYESIEAMPAPQNGVARWVAFVRHGEAGHNVDHALLKCPDNPLTEKGRAQALRAAEGPAGAAVREAQIVVTTPLTRAVQTTQLLLGVDGNPQTPGSFHAADPGTPSCSPKGALGSDNDNAVPSPADKGCAAHETPKRRRTESPPASSISTVRRPRRRVSISAAATERMAARCDEGTPKSELLRKLPTELQDWEGWDTLPETWWPEKGEDLEQRVQAFRDALEKYPQDRLTFVGHGAFWQQVCGKYLQNCEVVYCDRFLGA